MRPMYVLYIRKLIWNFILRYFNLASQCSLHSCTSSEVNSGQERTGVDSSGASYTTSLSTDTLYWEPHNEMTRQHSVKSTASHQEPAKPKSWDNLTTKAFGGYGFGYGYTEREPKTSTKKVSSKPPKYVQPTKSTESLLLLPNYPGLSDSSISCECLDATSPLPPAPGQSTRFFTIAAPGADPYYQRDKASQTERRIVNVEQAPEITRLWYHLYVVVNKKPI